MAHQPGYEMLGGVRQPHIVVFGVKGVAVALEQRLVHVHPAAVDAARGLGHKGGVVAVLPRYLFHYDAVCHNRVRHSERVCVPQVYFVLGWRGLVVAGLYGDAKFL